MTDNEFIDYFLKRFPQFEQVKDKIADYYNQALCRFPVLLTGRGTPKPDQPTFLFPPDLVGKRSSSLENARPVPTTPAFKDKNSGTRPEFLNCDCIDYNKLNAACLVVAHYLMVYEMPEDATAGSAGNGGGIVNSASVGDVSVGMQAKPINDMFEDFMASTVYGRDFLAWLASVGGITLIN